MGCNSSTHTTAQDRTHGNSDCSGASTNGECFILSSECTLIYCIIFVCNFLWLLLCIHCTVDSVQVCITSFGSHTHTQHNTTQNNSVTLHYKPFNCFLIFRFLKCVYLEPFLKEQTLCSRVLHRFPPRDTTKNPFNGSRLSLFLKKLITK